ncbi:MAG: hypothetical protein ABI175_23160 [Polyangiales bacterium]
MKRILLNVSAAALVASSALLFAACAATVDRQEKENVSGETVGALSSIKDLGEIPGTGETRTAKYTNSTRYLAYTFYADEGDDIDVWVRGAKGTDDDAVAWVLDSKDRTLGYDDDADTTTRDAHVVATAKTAGSKAKYRIVFRDYYLDKATFTVSVHVKPGLTKCTVDADCVKTKVGCCGTTFTAVNASRVDDVSCKPPYPPCAPPRDEAPEDTRVAICEADACKLVAPTDIACGGFIKNSHSCPDGFFCKKEGVPMDVPGKCVAGCFYGGTTRAVGESFPSTDGCNTCFCSDTGSVGCTKRACVPKCDEASEPNRKYVGHSPAQCMLVKFSCVPGTSMFSNDCGCGCEQPSDCPAFINCMPGPAPSTCAALRAKCPLSEVAY